jgi:hypothetical protein
MKSKLGDYPKIRLIFCLALVLSGCSFNSHAEETSRPPNFASTTSKTNWVDTKVRQGQSNSDGVTLQILFHSTEGVENQSLSGFLILSNGGTNFIRYTKQCNLLRSLSPDVGGFKVDWIPGFFMSSPLSAEQLAQSVQTLKPGESAELPFAMRDVSTNKIMHVTAHYYTDQDLGQTKALNLWPGEIDAEPVTVRFTDSPHYPLQRQSKTLWRQATIDLYPLAGTSFPVVGKKGAFEFEITSNQDFEIPVEVFINENNYNVWAGKKSGLYVEEEAGITGIQMYGGFLRFEKSAITKAKSNENLNDIANRYDNQVDHSDLLIPQKETFVDMRTVLDPWFFCSLPGGSQIGMAKLLKVHLRRGVLELTLKSASGPDMADIWIDLGSKKLLKAIENGHKTFPK